ncbi:MAG: hypothetical protein V2B19_15380 [Pseudomonadota bacterium]
MGKSEQIIRSACRMCHDVCHVLVHLEEGRVVKITDDPESPISRGYLCPKGAAAKTYATASPACLLWGSATDASASNYQTARSLLILRALIGNINGPGGDVL